MTDVPGDAGSKPTPERAANLIAIASGKGGVGKTWLAVTLAHALARRNRKVLLFDGDLGLANVDVQLGLIAKRDLGGVLGGRATLAGSALSHEAGFDIVAGHSGSGNLAMLPSPRVAELRRGLVEFARSYQHVVLDLGAGVEKPVRQLSSAAGTILVVTTDEPTAMTDAYAFIKVSHAVGLGPLVRIVVNMAQSETEGENTYGAIRKACETFLKFAPPLAGIIRRDAKVRDAIRAQTPLLTRWPGSDAAGDVEALAARLTDRA